MERDPRVICMGEDVGKMGGVFQSTAGLHKKFPDPRHRHAISETAIMGAALGAAASGLRADRRADVRRLHGCLLRDRS